MSIRLARPAIALSFAIAVAFALACSDSIAPGGSSGPKHPIVGVYDVTTSLESYEYMTGTSVPYTYDTVAAGPARLSGTLTIDDSIVTRAEAIELPLARVSMQETLCSTGNPPCTSAGVARSVDYTPYAVPLQVSGDSMGVSGVFLSSYELLRFETGTFAGDSIVGTLEWDARLGPAREIYRGTYVARRRP